MNLEKFKPQNSQESGEKPVEHRLKEIKDELDVLKKWNAVEPHPKDIDRIKLLETEIIKLESRIEDNNPLTGKESNSKEGEEIDDFDDGPEAQQLEILKGPVVFDWEGVDYKKLRQAIAQDSDLSEIYSQAKKELDPTGGLISRKASLLKMSQLINDDRNSLSGRMILNKFNDLLEANKKS